MRAAYIRRMQSFHPSSGSNFFLSQCLLASGGLMGGGEFLMMNSLNISETEMVFVLRFKGK